MTTLPLYEAMVRELTYAIRDLASAIDIVSYRERPSTAPTNRPPYTVVDEHNALTTAQGRIAGALQAAGQHVERLDRAVAIWDAAHRAEADRAVQLAEKMRAREQKRK